MDRDMVLLYKIVLQNDFMPIKHMDERVNQFSDYLIETSIDEDVIFPPLILASCNISSERITNIVTLFTYHL